MVVDLNRRMDFQTRYRIKITPDRKPVRPIPLDLSSEAGLGGNTEFGKNRALRLAYPGFAFYCGRAGSGARVAVVLLTGRNLDSQTPDLLVRYPARPDLH